MTVLSEFHRGGHATLAIAAIALAGCASSDVTGVNVGAQDKVSAIRVAAVSVTMETPKPNPKLEAALKGELEKTMPRCAAGAIDHRMEVAVTDFEDQDVAKAILIGDEIELQARVRFVDTATETPTGEYFVENSFFWGGILGAAMMSEAERKLSQDFAENVCEEIFYVKLKASG